MTTHTSGPQSIEAERDLLAEELYDAKYAFQEHECNYPDGCLVCDSYNQALTRWEVFNAAIAQAEAK